VRQRLSRSIYALSLLATITLVACSGTSGQADAPSALLKTTSATVPVASANVSPPTVGPNDYVVATTGSDSNPGTLAQPFATVGHARDVLRAWLATNGMTRDINVFLRGGNYYLASSDCSYDTGVPSPAGLCFTEQDSGNNGFTIHYRNYDAVGSARLLGGLPVTGWSSYLGHIYRAPWPSSHQPFNDLYENGVRAVKARTPNINPNYGVTTTSQGPYLATAGYLCPVGTSNCCSAANGSTCASYTQFPYASGDLAPASWAPLADRHVQVQIFSGGVQGGQWANWNWESNLEPVAAVDPTSNTLTLVNDNGPQSTDYPIPSGSRYFVQGDLFMLDAPGEFYLGGGYVYYYPRATPIAAQEVLAPQVKAILQVCPRPQAGTGMPCLDQTIAAGSIRVHDLSFEGLSLEGSDYAIEWPDRTSATNDPIAMVYLETTQNIAIKNCHLKNAGEHAIAMPQSNQSNVVYGNLIENSGVSAVFIRTWKTNVNGVTSGHVIQNNEIHFVGMHQADSLAVGLYNSGADVISHNLASYGPRSLMGGAYDDPSQSGNYWGYNRLFAGVQDSADDAPFDFGGNGTLGFGPLKIFEQTIIDTGVWDSYSNLNPAWSLSPWGFYLDYSSSNWDVTNVRIQNVADNAYNDSVLLVNGGTNVTLDNVTTSDPWQAGFDDSAMDENNIGLRPDFPPEYGNGDITWTNDNSAACTHGNAGWSYRNDTPVSDDFDGDETFTNTAGASVTCAFAGTEVRWAASTSFNRGTADVFIDGSWDATVDLSTVPIIRQNVVYRKTGLRPGSHTIAVVVRNDRAADLNYVTVDAIGDNRNAPPFAP
jgi:hypothetical protein